MGVSALELRRRVLMAQPHKERKTGGIVSFNTHVPQVLGVTVPLSPVQAGTGDPYPPGGGINIINVADRTITLNALYYVDVPTNFQLTAGETYTLSVDVTSTLEPFSVSVGCGANSYTKDITSKHNNNNGHIVLTFTPTEAQLEGRPYLFIRAPRYMTKQTATAEVKNFQLEKGSTAHDFAPYSNIRPISGRDGVTLWRTGRNLMQAPPFGVGAAQVNDFGADFQFDAITFSFKANNTIAQYTNAAVVDLREENGTHHYITLSNCKNSEGQTFKANTETSGIYSKTLTNIKFRYVYAYYIGTSYSKFNGDNVTEWQIEPGATASEYAPFSGESFPFTFPDTVYGGRLEPAAGRVVVEYAIKSVRDFGTWYAFEAGGFKGLRTRYTPLNANKSALMCSHYQAAVQSTLNPGKIVAGSWYYNLALCDPDHFITQAELFAYADAQAQAGQPIQIGVPLAEPLIVPLTPAEIRALMGENNVFADTGDVDVEFWTN